MALNDSGQQTSVGYMARAVAGLCLDSGRDTNVRSYVSEEASAEIRFGVFVAQGLADTFNGMLLLAAITDNVIGVTTREQAHARDLDIGATGILPKGTVGVASRGRWWVPAEAAMVGGSDVHIRAIAAGAEVAGAVRPTADGSDTIDASSWCRVVDYDATTGLAAIEFDVNNRKADKID